MKKFLICLGIFIFFFSLTKPVWAGKGASPAGNSAGVQSQNNEEGADVDDEEESATPASGSTSRSQTAYEHMSAVALKVEELLRLRTQGGIGEQIRETARIQNEAQERIQEELGKLVNRPRFLRFLVGPNYVSLGEIKKELEQNTLRIQLLEELQNQLTNQTDIASVQETIRALVEQNTSLQEYLESEEKAFNLLGWLFKLLAK